MKPSPVAEGGPPRPRDQSVSRLRSYYMLAVFTAISTVCFIDRQILVILQEPLKHEMGLSDSQLGLLNGFAFVALYVTFGLPIAYLADRSSRRNIVGVSLIIWSAMTAVTGLAQNYMHLLLARVGVGFGEAGAAPPTHSMIADLFAPKERATALSIYQAGYPLGVLIGFLFGGYIGQVYGWRTAFFLAGLPGLVLGAVIFATVREPARKVKKAQSQESFLQSFVGLWKLRPFRVIVPAFAVATAGGYGISAFAPVFLIRSYGLSLMEVGSMMAVIYGVGGLIAPIGIAALADRLGVRDIRWRVWLPAITHAVMFPLALGAFLSHNLVVTIACYAVVASLQPSFVSPMISALQQVVPANRISLTSSLVFFTNNLVGLGFGTLIVGMVSDALLPRFGQESMRYALAWVSIIYGFGAVLLVWAAQSLVPARHHRDQGAGSVDPETEHA